MIFQSLSMYIGCYLYMLPAFTSAKLHMGAFSSQSYLPVEQKNRNAARNTRVTFIVALEGKNRRVMHEELMAVSTPSHDQYGRHLSLSEVHSKYGASKEDKDMVLAHIDAIIEGAEIKSGEWSDFCSVTAEIRNIERAFDTELLWHTHESDLKSKKRSIRAVKDLHIDNDIADKISFISLNAPIMNNLNMAGAEKKRAEKVSRDATTSDATADASATIGISGGNEEAVISFSVICSDGSVNLDAIPCSSLPALASDISLDVSVTAHANDISNPYLLNTDPYSFTIDGVTGDSLIVFRPKHTFYQFSVSNHLFLYVPNLPFPHIFCLKSSFHPP